MQVRKFLGILSIIVTCAGCHKVPVKKELLLLSEKPVLQVQTSNTEKKHIITILVHGTKLFGNKVFKNFFHSPDGLVHASTFDKKYHWRTIADTLSQADPIHYPAENMYIFGWGGGLSFEERLKASMLFEKQLIELRDQYEKKYGIRPIIRIITHSHGGNVVLYLGRNSSGLIIDEFILLACPVQQETAALVNSPVFKEVFSLYSTMDLIQVIDPQGIYKNAKNYPLFSERKFIGEHINQVKIKLNGRSLLHIDFILQRFLKCLPALIEKLKSLPSDNGNTTYKIFSIHTKS